MILQGKGGVGKSFIASLLSQYLIKHERNPLCIDTDPINATFGGFKALEVKKIEIMEGDEINTRKFDDLIELIFKSKGEVVIDNGASSFVPLAHYLLSHHIPSFLKENGYELIIHTVVTGGQSMMDTLNGFAQLIGQFPAPTKFVVWLNEFLGPIEKDGKDFEQMKAYLENKDRVSAIIRLPQYKQETFGTDLRIMLADRLTFGEAIEGKGRGIMTQQRLKVMMDQYYDQIKLAAVV